MPVKRLVEIQGEMNDCFSATATHLKRFNILCDKVRIPPELRREFGEFYIDWGDNITNIGILLGEQTSLLLPLVEDLLKDTEKQIDELREIK